MSNNRITLKKLKHFKAGSQETPCFTAVVCLDGEEIVHVDNDGRGGCNNYLPVKGKNWTDIQRLEAVAKEIRPELFFEQLDTICYEFVENLEKQKSHQRQLKKCQFHIVSQKEDTYSIFTPFSQKIDLSVAMKTEAHAVHIMNCVQKLRDKGYTILNTNLGL